MFVRVKPVVQDGKTYEYLQIVRSVRDGDRVRQELVASLGRRDLLLATGKLDGLLQSLARFSTRLKVVEAAKDKRFAARSTRSWGAALVFGRLWQRQGLPEILERLAQGRKFEFDPERVGFALALQRLVAPGSDLQGAAWTETMEAPGFAELALHHFYRTLPWLAANRHELEQALFFRDRDHRPLSRALQDPPYRGRGRPRDDRQGDLGDPTRSRHGAVRLHPGLPVAPRAGGGQ
jgi:hypothetical protein